MNKLNNLKKVYYFASTHWDREWYKTINEFRFKLVPVMDKIISVLESDSTFTRFTLDGQTSLIDDYLEIRPENKERLIKLISANRLIVGPWYTMPDEFLVSYESLAQNLLKGHKKSIEYGGAAMKYGYVCDIFGHVANFPQILKGFDINGALLSRGLNDSSIGCHLKWTAPNGDSVTTFKAPEVCGYGSYLYEVLFDYLADPIKNMDKIIEKSIKYIERELERTSVPIVVLMDGMDHESIHEFAPVIVKRLKEELGCEIEFADMAKLASELSAYKLPEHKGEINELGKDIVMHNMLITHTLSSRYDLKKQNDICQTRMEKYAMPASVLAKFNDSLDLPLTYLDVAYTGMIENQAHDSICGCSIDDVHKDMLFRFRKSLNITNEFVNTYYDNFYQKNTDNGTENYSLTIFNPLPHQRKGEITAFIDFDPQFHCKDNDKVKFEKRNWFKLYDSQGTEILYNIVSVKNSTFVRNMNGNYNKPVNRYEISFEADLNAMSFTSFVVKKSDKPIRYMNRLKSSENACENEFIIFSINSNGTVNVFDKETAISYNDLCSLNSSGEIGDGWFHIEPISNRVVSSIGSHNTIEKVFDGVAKCVFRVTQFLPLPEGIITSQGFKSRSEDYKVVKVISTYTIERSSKIVKVKTILENIVRDHVVHLTLPTKTNSEKYSVNQCNVFLTRECGLNENNYDHKEADIGEKQFESIVYKRDENKNGLAFISQGGLHEVYCPKDLNSSIVVTLMRCFSTTFLSDGEIDGQLQGNQEFNYALLPLSAKDTNASLTKAKDVLNSEYDCFTIPTKKRLDSNPFFSLSSNNIVYNTMLCGSENSFTIRLTNYGESNESATLTLNKSILKAEKVNLLGNKLSTLSTKQNEITLTLSKAETASIKIYL